MITKTFPSPLLLPNLIKYTKFFPTRLNMAEDDRMDIDGMLPTTPGRSYFVFINGYIYISEIEEKKGTRQKVLTI